MTSEQRLSDDGAHAHTLGVWNRDFICSELRIHWLGRP
jgi:hypothetical protein